MIGGAVPAALTADWLTSTWDQNAGHTIDRGLRLLGLGAGTVTVVPADSQGRMVAAELHRTLAAGDGPTIVCAQAGEANTGAFDPFPEIGDACAEAGAWLHVDGAFGLWASVSPELRPLVAGVERADSWATDAHKWLNVPYDSGVVICARPEAHRAAMSVRAAYLAYGEAQEREQMDWDPESSRRASGFPVYAAIRSLGRSGIQAMVERCCAHACRFAEELEALGAEILNDVVLNQVLLRFETDEVTDEIVRRVQASGEAWLGGTHVGRPESDSHLRVELADDGSRRRAHRRSLPSCHRRTLGTKPLITWHQAANQLHARD